MKKECKVCKGTGKISVRWPTGLNCIVPCDTCKKVAK